MLKDEIVKIGTTEGDVLHFNRKLDKVRLVHFKAWQLNTGFFYVNDYPLIAGGEITFATDEFYMVFTTKDDHITYIIYMNEK